MWILYTALIILAVLLILYVLSVMPRKRRIDQKLLVDYAHRGLWGKDIPENSLKAFDKAVKNGFGIELDVQLSKDNAVMVFHDYTLKRMTGAEGKISELTLNELKKLSLINSEEKIPTFKEVLELVDGKVPLLIELKGENFDSSLCPKVAEILKEYEGIYCVESFNPLLIKNIKKYLPKVTCGQLYTNVVRDKKKISILNILLTLMSFNFLARPDFIAYNKETRNSLPVKIATGLFRAPKFVWTMKDNDKRFKNECTIFESEKF